VIVIQLDRSVTSAKNMEDIANVNQISLVDNVTNAHQEHMDSLLMDVKLATATVLVQKTMNVIL
jgi:phage-related protein